MNDAQVEGRNWLEQLASKIPGFSGYQARERRRDMDKLQREQLAERLRLAKAPLLTLMRELSENSARLTELGALDRLIKKLDRLENRIRFAAYGYAGFFDAVKIEEAELDALYSFDLNLVKKIDEVEQKIAAMKSAADSVGLKNRAAETEATLADLDHTFDGRFQAIESFNRKPGSNRSVFDA